MAYFLVIVWHIKRQWLNFNPISISLSRSFLPTPSSLPLCLVQGVKKVTYIPIHCLELIGSG